MTRIIDVADPAATVALGRRLGARLFAGAVVGLTGQLGAGKTFLARAIAEGLGVPDSRIVSSPTFVLIQEYPGRLPIYHFDAYRLKAVAEFADLGVHEYFQGDGVCLVEWADRVEDVMPAERLHIHLEASGPTSRRLTLVPHGHSFQELVKTL
jgi:tRNA threonylcarbamoyladenosine biosynthesis protein TsaE